MPRGDDFVSRTFYEGRLTPQPDLGLENQSVSLAGELSGAGLRFLPVVHRGNTNQSPEEVAAVQSLVERCLAPGSTFQSRSGAVRQLTPEDVLVVAPYNVQVAVLRRALPEGVASPELARASCKTPRQIKLVNALCAYLEQASR